MKIHFTWLAVGTAIAAAIVSLGACGGGDTFISADDEGGTTPPPDNDATTNPSPDGGGDSTLPPVPDGAPPPPVDSPVDVGPDMVVPTHDGGDCDFVPAGSFASALGTATT